MADVHSKATRSFNMSRIRSKDTKPEHLVRKFLFSKGFRYRLHVTDMPGKPDLVLPKYNAVIFVHGCYWHGHRGCKYFVVPKSRSAWWLKKITGNIERDKRTIRNIKKAGWRIFIIWECDLKPTTIERTLFKLKKKLTEK